MRKLGKIFAFLVGLIVVLAGVFYFYVGTLKPQYQDTVTLSGFTNDVRVVYDDFGIPHIYAENNSDAFKALGYVHAQDRLFQMEMLRRVGSGRLAEVFGKELANADNFFRTTGISDHCYQSAQNVKQHADSAWLQLANNYLEGINHFISVGTDPVEFKLAGIEKTPFTLEDLYYVVGYMTYSFDIAMKTDPLINDIHQRLGANYLNDLSFEYEDWQETIDGNDFSLNPSISTDSTSLTLSKSISSATENALSNLPIPPFRASNAWVVGSTKTKSGKVLFANDTHIGFSQPSVWFEAHIKTPDLNLYGNFLAGFPYPLVGHTDHHSWGLTMFLNDDLNLYKEQIENGNVYINGNWVPTVKKTDTIFIKGEEPFVIEREITPHGPIINPVHAQLKDQPPVAMSWAFLDFPMNALQAAHGFVFSDNIESFYKSASRLAAPGLNVMYGDVEDNIGWWAVAKLRKYREGLNSKLILDGSSGKDEILGYYSFDENPHAINPKEGFVYSANNQSISADSLIYPGYYYAGDRARAIKNALSSKNDWTVEETQELQRQHTSEKYAHYLSQLVLMVESSTAVEQQVLKQIQNWDGNHSKDAVAPTVFYKWIYHLMKEGLQDELGEEQFSIFMGTFLQKRSLPKLLQNDSSLWWDRVPTEKRELLADIAQLSFSTTVQQLTQEWGENPASWQWGKAHTLTHEHQFTKANPQLSSWLNVGPFDVNSGDEVLNKLSFSLNGDKVLKVTAGPAMRIVLDYANWENSVSINPTGQSGNPLSEFYQDQAQLFADEKYRKQRMNDQDINESKTYEMLIKSK